MKLNKDQKMFLLVWVPICIFIFMQIAPTVGTFRLWGGEMIYNEYGTFIGYTGSTPGMEIFTVPLLVCIFLTVLILHGLGGNNKVHTKRKEQGLNNA